MTGREQEFVGLPHECGRRPTVASLDVTDAPRRKARQWCSNVVIDRERALQARNTSAQDERELQGHARLRRADSCNGRVADRNLLQANTAAAPAACSAGSGSGGTRPW